MLRMIVRLIRYVLIAFLGAAAVAKLVLESNAEPETQDIDLVAIFGGLHLKSEADPFYGGKAIVACGGALIDLRQATPAPTDMDIDVSVMMGGLSIVVPEGWRVHYECRSLLGGFSDVTRTTADPDAPRLIITGQMVMAGIQATNDSPVREEV